MRVDGQNLDRVMHLCFLVKICLCHTLTGYFVCNWNEILFTMLTCKVWGTLYVNIQVFIFVLTLLM